MRVARALLGLIGTAILGLLATYIMIPEWVLMNLEQHLWQTIGGFLISAALGGAVVFIAHATYMGWRLGDKPCKAFDNLRSIDGLSECETLADVVKPVKKLSAKVDELESQISSKDAEIEALRSAKVPTRLDIAKSTLGDEGMRAFRALCAASTYVDGVPSRPLVFSMSDGKLSAIGLSRDLLLLMEEADVIRLSEMDEREVVGSQACETPVDIGCGITACSDFVKFDLAGGTTVEVRPVRLTWGTDIYVANGLYGADLGIASLTSLGRELAVECAALNPPLGMVGYIKDAYSAELRESRHHFRHLTKDGELRAP